MYHEVHIGNARICVKSHTPEEAIMFVINNGPETLLYEGIQFKAQEV